MNGSRRLPRPRPVRSLGLALVGALLATAAPLGILGQETPTVVYLVRHAEKAERPTEDPPLSAAGEARARALAHVLQDAEITRVHSTDTERTRSTAEPTASALGLGVELYDGEDLEGIAETLRSSPGRHLVVGHSDTTPRLVTLLGGEPGPPIVEAWEYDRLYVLTLAPDGRATTVLLRFGAPAEPGATGGGS